MKERDEISDLDALIRWGIVNASHQTEFEQRVRCNPHLALDADEFGTTLLMIAAGAGNFAATELLLKLGADVNALSQSGETPLINVIRETDRLNKENVPLRYASNDRLNVEDVEVRNVHDIR